MKVQERKQKKGFTLVELLVVIAIIVALAGISMPLIMNATKAGNRAEAASNAKTIAIGLVSFQQERSSYPNEATRLAIQEEIAEDIIISEEDDSNAYLSQLVAGDYVGNEESFHVPGIDGVTKGDNKKANGKLLAKGENGFSYIMAEDNKSLTGDPSYMPLIVTAVQEAGKEPKFFNTGLGSYYIAGRADGSSATGKISKETKMAITKSKDPLFATGSDSIYGDQQPILKLPLGFGTE